MYFPPSACSYIYSFAWLNDTLYLLCQNQNLTSIVAAKHYGSSSDVILIDNKDFIPSSSDKMVSVQYAKALFILQVECNCIWKIQIDNKRVSKFSIDGVPMQMSEMFNILLLVLVKKPDGTIFMECYDPRELNLIMKILFPTGTFGAPTGDVIKLSNGDFVVPWMNATRKNVRMISRFKNNGNIVRTTEFYHESEKNYINIDVDWMGNVFVAESDTAAVYVLDAQFAMKPRKLFTGADMPTYLRRQMIYMDRIIRPTSTGYRFFDVDNKYVARMFMLHNKSEIDLFTFCARESKIDCLNDCSPTLTNQIKFDMLEKKYFRDDDIDF